MNISYDAKFSELEKLNWLPWVGEKFDKKKIFIIGESHYDDKDEWLIYKNGTREFVTKKGIEFENFNSNKRKFFNQIEKVILSRNTQSIEERNIFWNSVAFYNLVQRLLDDRSNRPIKIDYDEGWETFLKIANVLKPSICIKFGLEGIGRLGFYLNNQKTSWKRDNIKEFYTRPFSINLTNGIHKMKIIFINHPTGSFGFRTEKWSKFVAKEFSILRDLILHN